MPENMFFYAFEVLPENEEAFTEYMEKHGLPVMSKYCKNWRLFKLSRALRGDDVPQYIGLRVDRRTGCLQCLA